MWRVLDGYRRDVSVHRRPDRPIPIEPKNKDLDRYVGQWVAIHEGGIVAFAPTASNLAVRLRELGLAGVARAEYVPEPVAGYKVGLG
jgi:hypothetical protein